MKKVLLVGDHGYDYEISSFKDSDLEIEELVQLVIENNGDYEDDENGFGAKFIEFESELTENDVELLNNTFLNSHESKLFLVEV